MSRQIFGIDVNKFVKFGKGKEGIVYRAPDNKLLKVYYNPGRCASEYKILKKMEGNPHFPKVYKCKGRLMLREFVDGTPIIEYLNANGLSQRLAHNLICLAEDFDHEKYLRLDGLDKHVFVVNDEKLMVIDPRGKKYTFNNALIKVLKRLKLDEFYLQELAKKKPDLAAKWYGNVQVSDVKAEEKETGSFHPIINCLSSIIGFFK